MEVIPVFESQQAVVEKINNHEVSELLSLDWEKITAGFKAESLQSIVLSICDDEARLAVVQVCLTQYKYYLLRTNYDLFQLTWETCNPFRMLCESMLCDFEEADKFRIGGECRDVKAHEREAVYALFETEQAKMYLGRLEPQYITGRRWRDNVSKATISQVAHILSGLLKIPDSRKWRYFEQYWNVQGLSKAFNARYGRPLDPELKALYPEYKGA